MGASTRGTVYPRYLFVTKWASTMADAPRRRRLVGTSETSSGMGFSRARVGRGVTLERMRDAVFYNYNGFDAVAQSKTSPRS